MSRRSTTRAKLYAVALRLIIAFVLLQTNSNWVLAARPTNAAIADQQSEPQLDATVDRDTVQIADPFSLTVSLTTKSGANVRFPQTTDALGPFQIVRTTEQLDIPTSNGRNWQRIYKLQSYESGDLEIPAVGVSIDGKEISSQPIKVTVQSVLEDRSDPFAFRDIKGVVDIPLEKTDSAWFVWAAIVCGSAIALGAIGLLFARKRTFSPSEWADSQLDDIERSGAFENRDVEIVLPNIADVMREYIHQQLDIAAPQKTTEEFLADIQNDQRLDEQHCNHLNSFLNQVDRVKFASYLPDADQLNETLERAREFVRQTSHENKQLEVD